MFAFIVQVKAMKVVNPRNTTGFKTTGVVNTTTYLCTAACKCRHRLCTAV